jgi:hypothetical protein
MVSAAFLSRVVVAMVVEAMVSPQAALLSLALSVTLPVDGLLWGCRHSTWSRQSRAASGRPHS